MITIFSPWIFTWTIREKKILQRIIQENEIDLVISDTRYGLWSSSIPSVIITHQISFRLPLLLKLFQYLLYRINLIALNRFTQCWIPDFMGYPNLGGSLTHKNKLPVNSLFIGLLSRFHKLEDEIASVKEFDVAVILSGPEPQRSILEKKITEQLTRSSRQSIIVCGLPGKKFSKNLTPTTKRISYLSGTELLAVIKSSKYIICRSGYSTIMDLITLKKKALLIPTPGQTEQEYLACYMEKQGFFPYARQKNFNLDNAIARLDGFVPDLWLDDNYDLLDKAIRGLNVLVEQIKGKGSQSSPANNPVN
jgi:uncharacterized protein (TIGR00661 family)